jgi:ankyrin repeat protein
MQRALASFIAAARRAGRAVPVRVVSGAALVRAPAVAAGRRNVHATPAGEEEFGPLHRAAFHGDVDALVAAARRDANAAVTLSGRLRYTPLHIAAARGHTAAVAALLKALAVAGREALSSAMQLEDGDSTSFTVAHTAANQGNADVLELLLDAGGVPATATTSRGASLLHAAAGGSDPAAAVACIRLLLARGASPNVLDGVGGSPLHAAAEVASADVVQALIAGGADVNLREAVPDPSDGDDVAPRGGPPLHVAAYNPTPGGLECVTALLKAGASPALADDLGQTALHVALTIPVTVARGVRMEGGASPVSAAKQADAHVAAIVAALLAAKADPTAATTYASATPLHYAALAGWHGAAAQLIAAGARADVRDSKGVTPLDIALRRATEAAAADLGSEEEVRARHSDAAGLSDVALIAILKRGAALPVRRGA